MTEKICRTDGCDKTITDTHTVCSRCRYRKRHFGDPLAKPPGRVPKSGPRCEVHGCLKFREDGQKVCRIHLDEPTAEVSHVYGEQVPIAPLLALVDERGGLTEVMDRAGLYNRGREHRPREAMRKMFDRAVLRGSISVYSADQIIVRLFRLHPCFVYGEAWWNTEEESEQDAEPERVAA